MLILGFARIARDERYKIYMETKKRPFILTGVLVELSIPPLICLYKHTPPALLVRVLKAPILAELHLFFKIIVNFNLFHLYFVWVNKGMFLLSNLLISETRTRIIHLFPLLFLRCCICDFLFFSFFCYIFEPCVCFIIMGLPLSPFLFLVVFSLFLQSQYVLHLGELFHPLSMALVTSPFFLARLL